MIKLNKKITTVLILTLAFFLSSCGSKKEGAGQEITSSSIIIGDLDWKEVTGLRDSDPIRKNSFAVADIKLPAVGARCTGFLISKDILMTNHHCVPNLERAVGIKVTFDHEFGVPADQQKFFDCSQLIGNHEELDFALLKCEGSPGEEYGVLELEDRQAEAGTNIYVVQQNCDYFFKRGCDPSKKYSYGDIFRVENEYLHDADTLGGSSGSPVFDASTHKVIGLHHAGFGDNGLGRGIANFAVPMYKILDVIKTSFSQLDIGGSSGGSAFEVSIDKGRNNNLSSADDMGAGFYLSAMIENPTDLDFYKVEVNERKDVLIMMESNSDLDIYILNSQGEVLAKSETSNNLEEIRGSASPGTYFILVKGSQNSIGTYELGFF